MDNMNKVLEQLTGQPIARLESFIRLAQERSEPDIKVTMLNQGTSGTTSGECVEVRALQSIDVTLCATLVRGGDDWRIGFTVVLSIFDQEIWREKGCLNGGVRSQRFEIERVALNCSIEITLIRTGDYCLSLRWSGTIYLPIIGWRNGAFDEQLKCLD